MDRYVTILAVGALGLVAACDGRDDPEPPRDSGDRQEVDVEEEPTDAQDTSDDLGLSCRTNPNCCSDQSSPLCRGGEDFCRSETDCHMVCGRCIERGCNPPPGSCSDAGDAGDAGGSAARRQLDRVDKSGGFYRVNGSEPTSTVAAVVHGAVDCSTEELPESPGLRIWTSGAASGDYDLILAPNVHEPEPNQATVDLVGLEQSSAEEPPELYRAVDGTLTLEGDAHASNSVELTLDLQFPSGLIRTATGECGSNADAGSGGDAGSQACCKRYATGEHFQCTQDGSTIKPCCWEASQYDSTTRLQETVTLDRCGGAGGDAGS